MVWVGDSRHAAWLRDPLPIALYELGSRARSAVLDAVEARQRAWRGVQQPQRSRAAGGSAQRHGSCRVDRMQSATGYSGVGDGAGAAGFATLQVALIRSLHSQGARACDVMQK
jgi:hypothetical protein